jgi:hypothetical protein
MSDLVGEDRPKPGTVAANMRQTVGSTAERGRRCRYVVHAPSRE